MREAVQRIYCERETLTARLRALGSVVSKLASALLTLAHTRTPTLFVCLMIFNHSSALA
ncbi:hypothetical protein BDV93DRAFT_527266 [Ceratobasidium sp. AG-I]|nr:hypothetical protein BDV93DRAFT_527266 [Ceratobasidium sp. AG-I]